MQLVPVVISAQSVFTYTFTVKDSSTVSTGIYRADTLVKTVTSNKRFAPGTYTEYAALIDNDSVPITNTAGLYAKVLTSNLKVESEEIIGNTSTYTSGPLKYNGLSSWSCFLIEGNNGFGARGYVEKTSNQFRFSANKPNERSLIFKPLTQQTEAIATDGVNVYWIGTDGNTKYWKERPASFVFASKIADNSLVTFGYGKSYVSKSLNYASVMALDSIPATGIAVQRRGNYIFIARSSVNKIEVSYKSGQLVKTITIPEPRKLTIDSTGTVLWVAGSDCVSKYLISADGSLTYVQQTERIYDPQAVALSKDGSTLSVADAYTHQIINYNAFTCQKTGAIGRFGGYYNDVNAADDRYYWKDNRGYYPVNICYEADNTLWVLDGGNYRLLHYLPGKTETVQFLPRNYYVFASKKAPERIFAGTLEFSIDYTKLGKDSWKFVRNWGAMIQPNQYNQYRVLTPVVLPNGKTYTVFANTITGLYDAYELTSTALRYAGSPIASKGKILADDGHLYGYTNKVIGQPMYYLRWPLISIVNDNPVWATKPDTIQRIIAQANDPNIGDINAFTPGQFTSNGGIVYFDPGKNPGNHIGLAKGGKFIWEYAPSTFPEYAGDFPNDGWWDIGNNVNVAGITAVAADSIIAYGYKGEFWKNKQANIWNLIHECGLMLTQFGKVRSDSIDKAPAGESGNAVNGSLVKVGDTLYLYHGEEGTHSAVHQHKITGLNTIRIQNVPVVIATQPTDNSALQTGLPFNKAVANGASGFIRSPSNDITVDKNSNWWTLKTNAKYYNKFADRDITITYRNSTVNAATVTRDLGTNNLSKWAVNVLLNYDDNYANQDWPVKFDSTGIGGQFFEILDANNKCISRFFVHLNYSTKVMTVYCNGVIVAQGAQSDIDPILDTYNDCTISYNSTTLTVRFGSWPEKTIALVNNKANVKSPKTVRFYYWNRRHNYTRQISFRNLKFIKS